MGPIRTLCSSFFLVTFILIQFIVKTMNAHIAQLVALATYANASLNARHLGIDIDRFVTDNCYGIDFTKNQAWMSSLKHFYIKVKLSGLFVTLNTQLYFMNKDSGSRRSL